MHRIETILRDQLSELMEADYSRLVSRPEERLIDLDSKLAQVVVGVRRCGKSTLCQKVLVQAGIKFAYVNFDDETLAHLKVEQLNEIIETLYRINGSFTHLFMDEIQNAPSWPLFVNRLLRSGLRLILTGSNANLLGDDLVTHLAGRYNEIRLYPFSFSEYCQLKGVDIISRTTKANGLREHALNEYLIHGGFPEAIGMQNSRPYVASLLSTVISKDICRRYKVRYLSTLRQLANTALDNFCQEMEFAAISEDLGIKSVHTTKNYISYLDNAYLIRLLHKYSYKSRERQSSRKCYAIDPAFVTIHDNVLQPENLGWRLENVVAIEVLRRLDHAMQEVYYIRQPQKYEVDFAVTDGNRVKELIQVTYDFSEPTAKLYNREVQGLVKAARDTHCSSLTLVMMYGQDRDVEVGEYTVHCVRAADWLVRRQ